MGRVSFAVRRLSVTVSLLAVMVGAAPAVAQSSPPPEPSAAGQPAAGQSPVPASAVRTGPQQAQPTASSGGGLADIVVTAQKRSENLQRVPIVITAVQPERLAAAGIQTTQGLAAVLPGLQLLNIAGSLTPRVRGVGSGFTAAGIEPPIASYVDDVYRAFGADYVSDFADVSQVALLKGPQGTLFGRNATGGVLQITTREPSDTFEGSFQTSFDNYQTTRSNVFVTGPVADGVAASFSGSYAHQGKGYGTNIATGNATYKLDNSVSVRAKLRARVGPNTTVKIVADYATREGPLSANFRTFPGYSTVFPAPMPKRAWDTNDAIDSSSSFAGGGVSLKVDQELGFARLTSISAYRDASIFYLFTNVPTPVPTTRIPVGYNSSQLTEELQLVSPTRGALSWTLGAFYYHNKADVSFMIQNFGSFVAPFQQLSFPAKQTADSVAGFAQATLKLGSQTRLTGGIRYTYDEKTFSGQTIGTFPNGVSPVLASVQNSKYKYDGPTWRIALDHDLAPNVLVYASYNRGLKSGGFNTTSTTNPPFNPERLDAYEAGIKSQFLDNRIRLNLGGFYYKYANIQVPIFTGSAPAIVNAASAENYGLDADFVAKVTSELSVTASANYLHARFTSFPNAPFAIANPNRQGSTAVRGDATGYTVPYSPTVTYTAGIDYKIPTRSGVFAFDFTDSYNSGFFTEIDNVLHQSSYHLLDASVAWTSPSTRYVVRAFVNNILDKAVVSQAVTGASAYLADYTNPPRVAGASVMVKF